MSEKTEQKRVDEDVGQSDEKPKHVYDFSELDGNEEFRSDNNKLIIRGRVTEELKYSHNVKDGKYYRMRVRVKNRNGKRESLPVIISEALIEEEMVGALKGKKVEVKGQLRSYNIKTQDGERYSETEIFAISKIKVYGEDNNLERTAIRNQIYIDGYVCIEPICRESLNGIKYTKIIAAVPGNWFRKDYITCLFWKDNSDIAEKFKVGDRVRVYGIIKNRVWQKKHFEGLHEVASIVFQYVSVIKVIDT